jgi:hypothetical protein
MFVTFRRLLILAALAGLSTATVWANTEPRLALIIGNASYKSSPLNNPVNDARLMDKVLKDAGFTTIKAENASIRDMRRLIRDFGDKLKASGGVGLFYFAGHGVQVRGENFLVSTDSDIRNEDEVADDSVNVSVILEKMQTANNRMNLIILDACRNNPFASKSRSALSGLAAINAPSGSLVAYSTAPGSVASDGKGQNGLYTEYLAKAISQPGLPVEEVFKQVRSSVRKDSNFQQTPWENTALEGAFFFKAAIPVVVVAPPPPPPVVIAKPEPVVVQPSKPDPIVIDMAFWESVKTSQRTGELQAYLTQFPSGVFAVLARIRIDEIKQLAAAPPPPPKPAVVEQKPLPVVVASLGHSPAAAQLSGPAIAAAAVQTSAPLKAQDGSLGSMVMTDTLFGKKTTVTVMVTDSDANQTAYSTGDAVGKNGQVLQVRVGEVVLRVTSGQLWTLPMKEAASGEARVRSVGVPNDAAGTIKWKSTPVGANKFRVDATVNYIWRHFSGQSVSATGNWTISYGGQGDLPESSSAVVRSTGTWGTNNIVSIEFKPG